MTSSVSSSANETSDVPAPSENGFSQPILSSKRLRSSPVWPSLTQTSPSCDTVARYLPVRERVIDEKQSGSSWRNCLPDVPSHKLNEPPCSSDKIVPVGPIHSA